jgi:hypothetical protein
MAHYYACQNHRANLALPPRSNSLKGKAMKQNTYHLAKKRIKALKAQLKEITTNKDNSTTAITAITTAMTDINNYITLYAFSSLQEELNYYKKWHCKCYLWLAYHTEQQKLALLKKQAAKNQKSTTTTTTLKWTSTKVDLIELLYAIQASGVLNNGKTTLKELITYCENTFQISLGQYSKTYLEIRSRKSIDKTQFLNLLKTNLLKKIDQTENN